MRPLISTLEVCFEEQKLAFKCLEQCLANCKRFKIVIINHLFHFLPSSGLLVVVGWAAGVFSVFTCVLLFLLFIVRRAWEWGHVLFPEVRLSLPFSVGLVACMCRGFKTSFRLSYMNGILDRAQRDTKEYHRKIKAPGLEIIAIAFWDLK